MRRLLCRFRDTLRPGRDTGTGRVTRQVGNLPHEVRWAAVPAPRIFLIDTYGFIFRAYHARARTGAPPMRTTSGISTEAVFIFTNMLRKLSRVRAEVHGGHFRKHRQNSP
jgi:hypothetical protein